jgi:hypothetical protein
MGRFLRTQIQLTLYWKAWQYSLYLRRLWHRQAEASYPAIALQLGEVIEAAIEPIGSAIPIPSFRVPSQEPSQIR